MCNECLKTPCHPSCPNADEPPIIAQCWACSEDIRKGDEYIFFVKPKRMYHVCNECIEWGSDRDE